MGSAAVQLNIEAVGVVCSLGLDLPNAAAAYRAGITRGEPDDDFSARDIDSGAGIGVTTHGAPLISHGFEGLPRFLRLVEGALRDIQRRLPDQFWKKRIGVAVVLPNPKRRYLTYGLLSDPGEQESARRTLDDIPVLTKELLEPLLRKAFDVAQAQQPATLYNVYADGAVGFIDALQDAAKSINAGEIDTLLICCADSFLDFATLSWLESTGRLKTPDVPVGMQPGEAAAVVAVTSSSQSNARLRIETTSSAIEDASFVSKEICVGRALAGCIGACLAVDGDDGRRPIWLVSDLNGESYKAQEWGHMLVRLREAHQQIADSIVWFPAMGVGEVGAAFPAMAIGFIQQSINRGYAPASSALVCCSADHGPRGAYLLHAAGGVS